MPAVQMIMNQHLTFSVEFLVSIMLVSDMQCALQATVTLASNEMYDPGLLLQVLGTLSEQVVSIACYIHYS